MNNVNYAQVEAIALKRYNLEIAVIYEKDEDKARKMYGEMEALTWVANLLGIDKQVSDIRQKQTELTNKSWEAAKNSVKEERKGDMDGF